VNLRRKRHTVSGVFLGVCLLSASTFGGQSGSGLEGTVLDPSGAIIRGAEVILFSDERVLTTETNENGIFRFASFPSDVRYIEASSPGFASVSIPITDKPIERVSFTLWPGEGGGVTVTPCFPLNMRDTPPASAAYEEKRGNVQVTGAVSDPSGLPIPNASLTLLRADPDALLAAGQNSYKGVAMKRRPFKESLSASASSDEKGEFRFSNLEPGWYALKVTRQGYSPDYLQFWVARENLTKLSRRLFPVNETYCR
jgi:Carboxypeptidase regulatory-like domain